MIKNLRKAILLGLFVLAIFVLGRAAVLAFNNPPFNPPDGSGALTLGTGAYAGNIGIGMANPSAKLHVAGGVLVEGKSGITVNYGSGKDGAIVVSGVANINTANMIGGRVCAQGGDAVNYSVTALTPNSATVTPAPAVPSCLTVGDEVLLINLQGISGDSVNVGNYEALIIQAVAGGTVTFNTNKIKNYGNGGGDANIGISVGNQRVMLQRVPNYSDVTINGGGTLTANAWNAVAPNTMGAKGGVLFFRSSGVFTNNGVVNVTALGYRGGAPASYDGESIKYTGGGLISPLASAGYYPPAVPANDGGGGGHSGAWYGSPGGGGYGTSGANGVLGPPPYYNYGSGGSTYGDINLSKLFLGSGGGDTYATYYGGNGGGIIAIFGRTINSAGLIQSNGGNSPAGCVAGTYSYGAAAGSGGSVLVAGGTVNIGAGLTLATGGLPYAGCQYNGGAGGAGRVTVYYKTSVSGFSNPVFSSLQVDSAGFAPLVSQTTIGDNIASLLNVSQASGNVGINNVSSAYKLDVSGDVNLSGQLIGAQLCLASACRSSWPSGPGTWTFGGMYSIYWGTIDCQGTPDYSRSSVNPYTGARSCLTGFNAPVALSCAYGSYDNGMNPQYWGTRLYFCYK